MLALALTVSLLPQGVTGLEIRLEELELVEPVAEVVKQNRGRRSRRRTRPEAPALVADLLGMSTPVLDALLERLDLPANRGADLHHMRLLVAGLAGLERPPKALPRRLDLRAYRSVLERAHRELQSVLGSGLELHVVVPMMHAILEQLRGVCDVSQLDREQLALIGEQVERLARVDHRRLLMLAHRVAAASVQFARDEKYLSRLARDATRSRNQADAQGDVVFDRETPLGRMVVGGTGRNVYDCSQIDVIVDLGGDDVYNGPAGATLPHRRLGVVFDLAGDDTYDALNDALGSATYGIGLLLDLKGNDHYQAQARSGGFAAAGAGVFLDLAGDDQMQFGYYAGGTGLAGIGVFADFDGNDEQSAAGQAFGFGMPAGIGLFLDGGGDDKRSLGAVEVEEHGSSTLISAGLGTGIGLQGVLEGGVGLAIDGGGIDVYEASGMVLGSGSQGGLGVFVDCAGDDRYQAGASSVGAACCGGLAVFVDAAGDDDYTVGGGMGMGAAACHGQAWCVDLAGADTYRLVGQGLGMAQASGLAGFIDLAGADEYLAETAALPWARPGEDLATGPSVSLFVDDGGQSDQYRWIGGQAPSNGAVQRVATSDTPDQLRVLADR